MKKQWLISGLLITLNAILLFTSCSNWNKTQKGAAIGGAAGAGAGAAVGSRSDNTILGALIGAAVGGAAGALIGNYMDKQAAELQNDLKNAKVERVGEGIKITFDSGLLFNIDSDDLSANSKANLDELAGVLQKYDDTDILIEGHTDNTGSDEHNLALSRKRAAAVSNYLTSKGVKRNRITENGYGENQPVADNNTDQGRVQNRRVDLAIMANEKLKKSAERGELGLKQ